MPFIDASEFLPESLLPLQSRIFCVIMSYCIQSATRLTRIQSHLVLAVILQLSGCVHRLIRGSSHCLWLWYGLSILSFDEHGLDQSGQVREALPRYVVFVLQLSRDQGFLRLVRRLLLLM
jgi:hypothetical protein